MDKELFETCKSDAIEEAINDRFEEDYEICEGCGCYIPKGETYSNDWFDCVCGKCKEMRPCDCCGELIPADTPANEDGEYYCKKCSAPIDIFSAMYNIFKPAI